jgi:hypothetical protein
MAQGQGPTLKFMYYLNIDVPQNMAKSWFNLCFLDSLVVILITEITTVHQAAIAATHQ